MSKIDEIKCYSHSYESQRKREKRNFIIALGQFLRINNRQT